MVEMYKATGDPAIQPSAISYNALINAHSKSNNPGNLEHAEKVLQEMIESSEEPSKPDAITFSTLMVSIHDNPSKAIR